MTMKAAAAAFIVNPRTAAKWVRRYQPEGRAGLADHSSRPHRFPFCTRPELENRIEFLCRVWRTTPES